MNLVILCGLKFRSEQRTKTQSRWRKQRGDGEKTRDMKKQQREEEEEEE